MVILVEMPAPALVFAATSTQYSFPGINPSLIVMNTSWTKTDCLLEDPNPNTGRCLIPQRLPHMSLENPLVPPVIEPPITDVVRWHLFFQTGLVLVQPMELWKIM